MDYYQGVVLDYLRANRSIFVNTECCIQIIEGDNPDRTGPHWYCDALAVDLRNEIAYLCETSFSKSPDPLLKRLEDWKTHWADLKKALTRDCSVRAEWTMRPWLFVPEEYGADIVAAIYKRVGHLPFDGRDPKITTLQAVAPWKYCSWNRTDEKSKPAAMPESMQA